ncbi:hypothetical protein [Microbacterium sp. APC 3901]|uniref:hypothetical protein n=1 Tax=Microbacterium sp. APC 3901 TaxID=3035192 RepID=UPI0025B3C009|nr:hypothetical protein [Microbacterium sp. APC 3901]MDN3443998.1 hypothetical protein [Microbacterium sp. APC 3901]
MPAHRQLDADGRPTVSEIAADIANKGRERSDLLSVEDAASGEVYGCCGLASEHGRNIMTVTALGLTPTVVIPAHGGL